MAEIRIVRRHALPMARVRALARAAARDFGVEAEWQGDVARFRRSGLEGEIRLTPSEVRVGVKLAFFLAPFKERLAKHMETHLDEVLGARRGSGRRPSRRS
jgi:putative polyhydroxyalkanoate system protein